LRLNLERKKLFDMSFKAKNISDTYNGNIFIHKLNEPELYKKVSIEISINS